MTYRERREAKAERLRGWAEKREAKASAAFKAVHAIADNIPLGQPILVGHHSERHARRDQERIHSGMRRGIDHEEKAKSMTSRADGIDAQLDTSIYRDDENAVEALKARITERELVAAHEKKVNAAYRKGGLAAVQPLVTDKELQSIARTLAVCPYLKAPYFTTNTRASIRRDQERLKGVERTAQLDAQAREAPGGVLVTTAESGDYCNIRFAEKPERAVLDTLKGAGFAWTGGCWGGYKSKLPEGFIDQLSL